MTGRRWTAGLVVAVAVVLVGAAVMPSPEAQEPIKFGFSAPLTSPIAFIAYPTTATLSERHRVTAAAARAHRAIASRNASVRQSSVMTWNRRPARTIAFAVSCAPWMPWL